MGGGGGGKGEGKERGGEGRGRWKGRQGRGHERGERKGGEGKGITFMFLCMYVHYACVYAETKVGRVTGTERGILDAVCPTIADNLPDHPLDLICSDDDSLAMHEEWSDQEHGPNTTMLIATDSST